jgi:hypothetical protein
MSEASEIEKILSSADKLKFLGQNRAFVAILFAIWANRKRGWLSQGLRIALFTAAVGSYEYWMRFFG